MKLWTGFACMLLLAGAAGAPGGDRGERHQDGEHREEDSERRERGLQILRADYGAEGQFANVTEALRSQIDDGRLLLFVDNDSMGVDPTPGTRKRLRILYVQDGER